MNWQIEFVAPDKRTAIQQIAADTAAPAFVRAALTEAVKSIAADVDDDAAIEILVRSRGQFDLDYLSTTEIRRITKAV